MKQYRLGFSAMGAVAVALVLLPNLLYLAAAPPNDVLAGNDAGFWLWDVLENAGRVGLMAALVFVVNRTGKSGKAALPVAALCCLLAYYALWVGYFMGAMAAPLLVGLAVFPTLFFLLVALWLKNRPAAGFAVLFGVVHIGIICGNFFVLKVWDGNGHRCHYQ